MPVSYEIDPIRSLVRIEYVGVLSAGAVTQVIQQLIDDPRLQPGMGIVSDHSRGANFATPDLVLRIMPRLAKLAERLGPLRIALVTPRAVQVGMANLAAVHAQLRGVRIEPFASREEAEAWLAGGDEEAASSESGQAPHGIGHGQPPGSRRERE